MGEISTIPSHGSMAAYGSQGLPHHHHIRSNIDAGFLLVGPHGASCAVSSAPGDNAGASCTAFVRQDGWLFVICGVLLWSYEDQVSCSLHMDQQRNLVLESLFYLFLFKGEWSPRRFFTFQAWSPKDASTCCVGSRNSNSQIRDLSRNIANQVNCFSRFSFFRAPESRCSNKKW